MNNTLSASPAVLALLDRAEAHFFVHPRPDAQELKRDLRQAVLALREKAAKPADEAAEGHELVAHLVNAWSRNDDRDLCHWTNKLREWAGIPA